MIDFCGGAQSRLLGQFLAEHQTAAAEIDTLPPERAYCEPQHYERVSALAHAQAEIWAAHVTPVNQRRVAELIHRHPLHEEVLLQSAFIRHAYQKPYGYPGDKDLMLMIGTKHDYGASNYSVLHNRVYLNLPAAAAVRQRVRTMYRRLVTLPDNAKVLVLACGPALEVRYFCERYPQRMTRFDLIDHDPRAIAYTRATIPASNVRHFVGSALEFARGKLAVEQVDDDKRHPTILALAAYDVVYAMGLYDYLSHYPGVTNDGTLGLTKTLFSLVKPGGQLIVGNYLEPSATNPHKHSHRLMMELYSEWYLRYRNLDEIHAFMDGIPPSEYSAIHTNEYLGYRPDVPPTIGFLVITKQ